MEKINLNGFTFLYTFITLKFLSKQKTSILNFIKQVCIELQFLISRLKDFSLGTNIRPLNLSKKDLAT